MLELLLVSVCTALFAFLSANDLARCVYPRIKRGRWYAHYASGIVWLLFVALGVLRMWELTHTTFKMYYVG